MEESAESDYLVRFSSFSTSFRKLNLATHLPISFRLEYICGEIQSSLHKPALGHRPYSVNCRLGATYRADLKGRIAAHNLLGVYLAFRRALGPNGV